MKYLIYETENDARERNHEAWLQESGRSPESYHDTAYLWASKTHPSTGEVALCIPEDPDGKYPLLDANEILDLDDVLTPDWEVSE